MPFSNVTSDMPYVILTAPFQMLQLLFKLSRLRHGCLLVLVDRRTVEVSWFLKLLHVWTGKSRKSTWSSYIQYLKVKTLSKRILWCSIEFFAGLIYFIIFNSRFTAFSFSLDDLCIGERGFEVTHYHSIEVNIWF